MEDAVSSPFEASVATLMTRDVVTVSARATVREAMELLLTRDVSGLPVLGDEGELVGVVSLTDVVAHLGPTPPPRNGDVFYTNVAPGRLLQSLLGPLGAHAGLVRDVMSPVMITVDEGTTIRAAAGIMASRRIHRVLCVDAKGQVSGLLSSLDVVRLVAGGSEPIPSAPRLGPA